MEISITTTEFAFEPSEIVLTSSEAVNILLSNVGGIEHDLTIPDLDFRLVVGPGDTATGALLADQPGRYEFLCSLPGHAQAGMIGTLVVS